MDLPKGAGFASRLRSHRLADGLTQAELATRSGLSLRAISDLERGLKRFPRPHTIALLAGSLQLSRKETLLLAQSVGGRTGSR